MSVWVERGDDDTDVDHRGLYFELEINRGDCMSFDELQARWQAHDHEGQLNIDPDALLEEVRRNQRDFENRMWRRDFGEVTAAVLVTFIFGTLAVSMDQWSLFLGAAGSLFVGIFMVFDRLKQRRQRTTVADSLPSAIDASLVQVQHQIWLLRNILWWYLLPLVPGPVAILVSTCRESLGNGLAEQLVIAFVGLICLLAFWGVYWINQREITRNLEPRRIELEELRASLSSGEIAG